jgi:hypothetical protein
LWYKYENEFFLGLIMGKRKLGDCVDEEEETLFKRSKPSSAAPQPAPSLFSFWQDIGSACKGSLTKYYSSYYQ